MSTLQISLIIITVLIAVTIIITYLVRNRYYEKIDELNQKKSEILEIAPYKELKEVNELNLTGQSHKLRDELRKKWKDIESIEYPKIENYLCGAERATDNYRLGDSKKNQDEAKSAIITTKERVEKLKDSLLELIEQEQANLKKIDSIKNKYHDIRKSLLAYSFSFGPASESFEQNLNSMEKTFTDFSELTVAGDHEEANKIVEKLNEYILETEEQMDQIPPLLTKINNVYNEQIEDLYDGYNKMTKQNYIFPEDTILDDLDKLIEEKEEILNHIKLLEVKEAENQTERLEENIESLYQKMEKEIEMKPKVPELLHKTKQAIYFLRDENRNLNGLMNRISQSYQLVHNESSTIGELEENILLLRTDFEKIDERLNDKSIAYSTTYSYLEQLFNELENLNKEYKQLANFLNDYRQKEKALKDNLSHMEQAMYAMKRTLENERLPGLPEDYLELFFSASDRIESFASELVRPKINLIELQKLNEMCEEDVIQLSDLTEEIIRQVELTERVSQKLYRYKDTHKGILETIKYSQSLFNTDFDYDTSLRLVREKLENIEPGSYKKIVEEYENETEQEM